MQFFGKKVINRDEKTKKRSLRFESLENRELMSASPLGVEFTEGSPMIQMATSTTSSQILAKPQYGSPQYVAMPSTITVNWKDPVASGVYTVSGITSFRITVTNKSTKQVVETTDVGASARSYVINNLTPSTAYTITIASMGDGQTTTASTLSISATTKAFRGATISLSDIGLTGAAITIKDPDPDIHFDDGKTVKTYAIEYVPRLSASTVPEWTKAKTITIPPGTVSPNPIQGIITTSFADLSPATQYYYRITTSYGSDLKIVGNPTSFKTATIPTASILAAGTGYCIDQTTHEFSLKLTCQQASSATLNTGVQVSYQLMASLSTAIDSVTGQLANSVTINSTFGARDSAGKFTMTPVPFSEIVTKLGTSNVLNSTYMMFQLLVTYDFGNGNITSFYTKPAYRLTLPTWYRI